MDGGSNPSGAPSEELIRRHALAREVIAEAGRLALDYFDRLDTLEIHSKGVQDMASEADLAVEALIRERLADALGDGFLGEETGHTDFEDVYGIWVVDPIDGTQPFVSGMFNWCISIAFVRENQVQFGMVLNPATKELFEGGRWFPATRNDRPISPAPATSLADGMTGLGASPRLTREQIVPVLDRLLQAHGMYVRGGSGALNLCDVACGRLIGYVEAHINAWDCLGAIAVLEAAGCRVNDYLVGNALLEGNRIIAGAPGVYDQLVALYD